MKTTQRIYSFIAFVLWMAALGAYAETPRDTPPPPPDDGMMGPPPDGMGPGEMAGPEHMAQKLGLSKEQVTQLRDIRHKYVDELKTKREALHAAHDKMREMMSSDKSVDEIKVQHEAVKSLHNEMADLHFKIMLETRDVLTPEQRVKFASLVQKKMGHGKRHDQK